MIHLGERCFIQFYVNFQCGVEETEKNYELFLYLNPVRPPREALPAISNKITINIKTEIK